MYCTFCGRKIEDGYTLFCPDCGRPVAQSAPREPAEGGAPEVALSSAAPRKDESQSFRNLVIVIAASLVFVVLVATILGVGVGAVATRGTGQENIIVVFSGSTVVGAGSSYSREFAVPAGATNVQIQGTFTAAGEDGNQINAYVMTSKEYVNWENGHSVSTNYDSGLVVMGTFDKYLSSGTSYYLVFDNTFSVISSKTVYATVTLTYNY